ncbi:MAG: histidine kinase [Aquamicrobium sp.]|nr:histidine kinase [Aquamicrobium sp.]
MPTLFRFLTILAVLAGLAYGAMYALAVYFEPRKGEMTVRIPPERLNPQR